MNALLLIDIQYDFLPGGALAVGGGDAVIAVANAQQPSFDIVVATQDWHPRTHASFASNNAGTQVGEVIDLHGLPQMMWPDHCVQETHGAAFSSVLQMEKVAEIFRKGTDAQIDSYSGFFDNGHRKATGMGDWLKHKGVTHVSVLGLATDYCVKFTALDAVLLGFHTTLIEDGCRGVELQKGDVARAIEEMRAAGVTIGRSV